MIVSKMNQTPLDFSNHIEIAQKKTTYYHFWPKRSNLGDMIRWNVMTIDFQISIQLLMKVWPRIY